MLKAIALVLCLADPLQACETALLLAVDISGSVDAGEYALQMSGLAAALEDHDIADLLVEDSVALSLVHWSGLRRQKLLLPWRHMVYTGPIDEFFDQARMKLPPFLIRTARRLASDSTLDRSARGAPHIV